MGESDHVDWDSIMRRLSAIKSLAERGGSLAEAETAAAMMARLLLRYNLSLLDVEQHATESNRAVTTQDVTTTSARWRFSLLSAVARGHLCDAVYHTRTGHSTVVGHAHNLIVVREMYLWLIDEINRLTDEAHAKAVADREWDAIDLPRTWKNAFRTGAVNAIGASYRAMLRQAEHETASGVWALVPVLTAEVATRFAELFPRTTTASPPSLGWIGGFVAGVAAGSTISLRRQVGAARQDQLAKGR